MPRKMPIEADANLRKAREAALLAVETYNRPGASFRTAGFLVLMVVAWTSLFHAIFAKRKVKPYYRQKRNPRRFEKVPASLPDPVTLPGGDSDGEVARRIQHGTAALGAGLQAAGTASHPAETTGAWRCGKRFAFPTSPHPRRRLRTIVQRSVTLTFHLVQKIGQVTELEPIHLCKARSGQRVRPDWPRFR
jgi:hypothetical protein